jgi:hypothetical protein
MSVIFSADEFQRKLSPGDEFWTIETREGVPVRVEGPLTVIGYSSNEEEPTAVLVHCVDSQGNSYGKTTGTEVAELTAKIRGVSLCKRAVYRHFAETTLFSTFGVN